MTYSEPNRTPEPQIRSSQRYSHSAQGSARANRRAPREQQRLPSAPTMSSGQRVPVALMSPAQRRRHLRGRGRRKSPKSQKPVAAPQPVQPPRPASLEYSKLPRKVKYKPYKLEDLRQMPKRVEMGPLQWRETEELMQKRAVAAKARRYAQRANEINKQILGSRPPPRRPPPQRQISKFDRAKAYGRSVPKPRLTADGRQPWRSADHIERREREVEVEPLDELQLLSRQHEMDRDLVARIKRDLAF